MIRPLAIGIPLLLLLATSAVRAAPAEYRIDTWTIDSGLPHNNVNSILQTRDGYMWFATNDGLVRFDGVRFRAFNRVNTSGMTDNRCMHLAEDRDGVLWIAGATRDLTRYRDGVFSHVGIADGLPDSRVVSLNNAPDGTLLVFTEAGMFHLESGRFAPYTPDGMLPQGEYTIRRSNGPILDDEASCVAYQNGRFYPVPRSYAMLVSDVDDDGAVLVATPEGALELWRHGNAEVLARDYHPDVYPAVARLARNGILWMGTSHDSVSYLENGRITTIPLADGIPDGSVLDIYEDREGLVWIGTTLGLCRLSRPAISVIGEREGLTIPNLYPVLEDREGAIWTGSWRGFLYRIRDNVVTTFGKAEGVPSEFVSALYEDSKGRLWVGTQNAGAVVREDGGFRPYDTNDGLGSNNVSAIAEDRSGAIWIGTSDGVSRLDNGRFTTFTTADGLPDPVVRAMHFDRDGVLWIGTMRGLSRLRDGRLETVTAQGLSEEAIRTIHEDGDGVIWIGTYDGGLFRLRGDSVTHYTVEDGLFDNGVFEILEDAHANFWMSCNRGIYRVSRADLEAYAAGRAGAITCVSFNRGDGLLTVECNGGRQPAGWRTRDGRLLFPTQEGLAVIDPESIPTNPLPPGVAIEEVLVDNELAPGGDAITVAPGQSMLEIRYTGLSFVKPEGVRFKYKMEGADDEWVDVGNRRAAYFSHLAPGSYVFTVIAANSDGVWNTQGRSLKVVVLTPFWRAWWFIALATGSVAAALFGAHQRRIAVLRRKHAEQEAFSRRLIESQEAERKRIASELHDGLGQLLVAIRNRAMLGASEDGGDALTGEMEAIAGVASQAVSEVRTIAYGLHPYQLDRLGLTKAIESIAKSAAASSEIDFTSEIDPVDGVLDKEAEINLYRIVQESVQNVLKHSQATRASVVVRNGSSEIDVAVVDDGTGLPAAEFTDLRRRGLGLSGMAERAKMLGGELWIDAAPGGGTAVRLRFTARRTDERTDNPRADR